MKKIFIRKILRTALCLSLAMAMCVPLAGCGDTARDISYALDEHELQEQMSAADSKAKQCHIALSHHISNDGINNIPLSGSAIEGHDTTAEYSGKTEDLSDWLDDDFTGYYYAEYNPETYSVFFVVWSASPIPDEYKCQLSETDQDYAYNAKGQIIGCYPSKY